MKSNLYSFETASFESAVCRNTPNKAGQVDNVKGATDESKQERRTRVEKKETVAEEPDRTNERKRLKEERRTRQNKRAVVVIISLN